MRTSVVTGERLLILDCRLLIEKFALLVLISNQKSSISNFRCAVSVSATIPSTMP
jgi:hypothetical protein